MPRTPRRGDRDDAGWRGLAGSGGSDVGTERAMRARDVSREPLARPGDPKPAEPAPPAPDPDR